MTLQLPLLAASGPDLGKYFDSAAKRLDDVSTYLYGGFLAWLLIAVGVYFTIRTFGLQFRFFGHMVKVIADSRESDEVAGSISSFQAFAIGIASRVGTGNIVGVAIAITMGGPGAVFWMWLVALVGMATGFIESTLAQMFKVPHTSGSFRGGPAYYISQGLGSKTWGSIFAVVIVFVFGFAYEATQANTIASNMKGAFDIDPWITGLVLVLISAPIVFRGIRQVATIAEWMAPFVAGLYALIAIVILVLNFDAIPGAVASIFLGAFGLDQAFAGIGGGIYAAAINGIKRGLFSNEAGEGSVPNAAATATTAHPANQGFIQSLGVFVDTIVVCTATALIILLSGVYDPATTMAMGETVAKEAAGTLTTASTVATLGGWAKYLMIFIIFVFAYSSLLGNYTYAEVNVDFLSRKEGSKHYWLRTMILVATYIGATSTLTFVWNLSDVAMGLMAIINIVSIVLLGKWAFGALRDWEHQHRLHLAGKLEHIRFNSTNNPFLPGKLPGEVWAGGPHRQPSSAQKD
ncbi:Na+/alanine symporter [Actinomyces bovis]|uniref:Na+/alanine symporter n=1 Tax=Actinomyces bovis TaxID=1658 RepID=A0ABY1VP35_9ACTO|nr:alanine/glycine:cation symporter family protein [Actinomyces bovis]SPT53880.1 Na+/alanine symporter [Actinomyces bovis]VEG53306.1 Na+/alanine symporter [Actinomyces israelii]